MRTIKITYPRQLVFGNDCYRQFLDDFIRLGFRHVLLVVTPQIPDVVENIKKCLHRAGIRYTIIDSIVGEPDVALFEKSLQIARQVKLDSVVGMGGGSVLDVAKLLAALYDSSLRIQDVFGIGHLNGRRLYLSCLPTTAGTGSEVSPNAIFYDPAERLKKGVVSPFLVPDAAYIDPTLTRTVSPAMTAATGMDALTHCIEAYTNRFAHPMIDTYALEGIRRIGRHLRQAVQSGDDLEARENVALGSMYGGMCLGPVNTAAVHALAYPLGSEFRIVHGLSNAVLLPHVMAFNLPAAPERHAHIAIALGAKYTGAAMETAVAGIEKLKELYQACAIPMRLSQLNITRDALEGMARSAITIVRLLKNNLRKVSFDDVMRIYEEAY